MIVISLYFNLSSARISQVKVFPVEALDLSIFITLILVGAFRNLFNHSFTNLAYTVTCLLTLTVMGLCVYLTSFANTQFSRVSSQFYYLMSNYDSATSILNCVIFCLAISLFLEKSIKIKILCQHKKSEKGT